MLTFSDFMLLVEDRLNAIKSKFAEINSSHDHFAKDKSAHEIVDHIANSDPTPNKQYTQWAVQRYHKGQFRLEDSGRLHSALSDFHKYKAKLPNKDINQYKHLSDVETAVEPHIGTASSGKEEKRIIKSEGADLVHENEHAYVHKLKTKEAACQYGAGTKWCTAAKNDNMFNGYNKQGPLYVVQGKHDGRKYQMHFETDQFMDEQDRPVELHDLSQKYKLHGVKEFEHKHTAFMKPENLKKPEYLLQHQEAIAKTGTHEHISALLDAAK